MLDFLLEYKLVGFIRLQSCISICYQVVVQEECLTSITSLEQLSIEQGMAWTAWKHDYTKVRCSKHVHKHTCWNLLRLMFVLVLHFACMLCHPYYKTLL